MTPAQAIILISATAAVLLLAVLVLWVIGRRATVVPHRYVPGMDLIHEDETPDEVSPAVTAAYELLDQLRAERAPMHLINEALDTVLALTAERA